MADTRFIGRREYFGSLFYDVERGDYIPFDWDATYMFELSNQLSLDDVMEKVKGRISRESFMTFIQLCQSIELFDQNKKFAGEFLPFLPVKDRLSAPLRVHLQLTNKCELNCKHCSQDTRDQLPDELNMEELIKLIDQLASIGVYDLTIGGGDPFLREKELIKVVEHAVGKRMSVYISCTGLFIGRVTAKKLSEYPIKGFRISFDGSTEKSFDYQRGKGTYRRVVRSIKTLRELFSCPITLHSVIMNSNQTEILTLLRSVQKFECNQWSVDFAKPVGQALQNRNILLSDKDIRESFRTIKKLQQYSSTPIILRHFPYQARGNRIYKGFGCAASNLNCWIASDGIVYPCSFLRNFASGSIREYPLRDIWIFSANLQLIRSLQGNDTCRECSHLSACRGGCRARAVGTTGTGNMEALDPGCFLQIKDEGEDQGFIRR